MNQAEADKIIKAEVKAILARGEPLDRLLDDYVRAALFHRHPGFVRGNFLPHHVFAIYDKYVTEIDRECTLELEAHMKRLPGQINIALDGATVNNKQKVSAMSFFWLVLLNSK